MSGCHVTTLCTCKCHLSQMNHCAECSIFPKFTMPNDVNIKETLALCAHGKAIKFGCMQCISGEISLSQDEIARKLSRILKRLEELEGSVKELKRFQDITHHEYHTMSRPHQCPVCDGSGGVKHPLTGLVVPASCHACDGKGLVWS